MYKCFFKRLIDFIIALCTLALFGPFYYLLLFGYILPIKVQEHSLLRSVLERMEKYSV